MMKPYKCRVEYLESTGTQYIDTGITINTSTDEVVSDFQLISTTLYQWIMGEHDNGARFGIGVGDGTNKRNIAYGATTYKVQDIQIYNEKHNFKANSNGVFLDNVQIHGYENFESSSTVYLFNLNLSGANGAAGKIWCYKHKRNGTLVRDMIPVLDNSGRPAMYDQVSGQLFYNQGSGDDFSYGRQIIPVEYLEGTGTQYIDTGLDYFADFEIGIQLRSNVSNKSLGNGGNYCLQRYNSSNPYWCFSTGSGTSNSYITSTPITEHHVMKWKDNKIYADDILLTEFTKDSNTPNRMYLYSVSTSNKYPNVIYFCKLWNPTDGTLVRDFIPCIDENNTPFMFDKVNNTVYLNVGTGQFKVGPYKSDNLNKKMLRKKLALMLANLKKKRKYYCEVEHIEGTGTQYINTGYTGNSTTRVIIGASSSLESSNIPLFGARDTNGYYNSFSIWQNTGANGMRFDYTDTTANVVYSHSWLTTGVNIIEKNGRYNYVNGVQVTSNNEKTFSCNNPFYLMAINTSGIAVSGFIGSVSFCKIYENGTLVRDMVPVLDWNYVPCMYDKVTEQLFYNAGTGNFVAGREIHPVEYLYTGDDIDCMTSSPFTSTSYRLIDTKETIDLTSVIEIKFAFDKNIYFSGCGLRNNSSNMTQSVYFPACYSTQDKFGWTIGSGEEQRQKFTLDTNDHIIKVDLPNSNVIWDNVDYPIENLTYTPSERTFPLFAFSDVRATQDNGYRFPMQGKIYYAKFWKNGIPTKDFIPAIDSNGTAFLFDRVSHTIYDNAGTGAFSYPGREVEYLQSDGARAIGTGVTVDDTCGFDIKWMALTSDDRIIMGTKGSGESRWVLSGSNNLNVNISWNTSYGNNGLGLNQIQTARMNYLNDRKRILNDTPLEDITTTLSANASTYNVGIFAGYWGSGTVSLYSTCRIYYAKISKGMGLIRDFIPMVKDGSPCLYDKVGGLYYFGAGTGTFTRGKIVEPEYE